jgi:hypothetical protein
MYARILYLSVHGFLFCFVTNIFRANNMSTAQDFATYGWRWWVPQPSPFQRVPGEVRLTLQQQWDIARDRRHGYVMCALLSDLPAARTLPIPFDDLYTRAFLPIGFLEDEDPSLADRVLVSGGFTVVRDATDARRLLAWALHAGDEFLRVAQVAYEAVFRMVDIRRVMPHLLHAPLRSCVLPTSSSTCHWHTWVWVRDKLGLCPRLHWVAACVRACIHSHSCARAGKFQACDS